MASLHDNTVVGFKYTSIANSYNNGTVFIHIVYMIIDNEFLRLKIH